MEDDDVIGLLLIWLVPYTLYDFNISIYFGLDCVSSFWTHRWLFPPWKYNILYLFDGLFNDFVAGSSDTDLESVDWHMSQI